MSAQTATKSKLNAAWDLMVGNARLEQRDIKKIGPLDMPGSMALFLFGFGAACAGRVGSGAVLMGISLGMIVIAGQSASFVKAKIHDKALSLK